jgi:hypothetical protein
LILTKSVIKKQSAMKTFRILLVLLISCAALNSFAQEKAGYCSKGGMKLERSPKEKMKRDAINKYTCSMHPEVTANQPGICPKCNRELVDGKAEPHPGHH